MNYLKYSIVFIVLIIFVGCTTSKTDTANNSSVSDSNSLVVAENCVIFLWPDSTEIAELQATTKEDVYNEIIADMTWYPGIATGILDSFQIKSIGCDQDLLILKTIQGKEKKLNRREIKGDMILFRVDKEPIITYAIDFDKELTLKYFDK